MCPFRFRNATTQHHQHQNATTQDHQHQYFDCSCPYFRNEIGGEVEKQIALTRDTGKNWGMADDGSERSRQPCHTPRQVCVPPPPSFSFSPFFILQARGFCLLEHSTTHWKSGICPYGSLSPQPIVERTDTGSTYFRHFCYGKEHQNWFGVDEALGPVALSIRYIGYTGAGWVMTFLNLTLSQEGTSGRWWGWSCVWEPAGRRRRRRGRDAGALHVPAHCPHQRTSPSQVGQGI